MDMKGRRERGDGIWVTDGEEVIRRIGGNLREGDGDGSGVFN